MNKIKAESVFNVLLMMADAKFKDFLDNQENPRKKSLSYYIQCDIVFNRATGEERLKYSYREFDSLPEEIRSFFLSRI